jgi:hypothetical protein
LAAAPGVSIRLGEEKEVHRRGHREQRGQKREEKGLPQREQLSRPDWVGVNAGNGEEDEELEV